MSIEKTKALTTIRSDDDTKFFDFGYDNLKYPSQGIRKEISNMFASTLFSKFKEEFKYGRVNPNEHYDKFIFIISQNDRKDSHNLIKGSIVLRIGQVSKDVIIQCNNGKEFNVSDIKLANTDIKAKTK